MNENEIINLIRKQIKNPSALNIKDDVFFDNKNKLVASIDTYNEKVHFLNFKKPDLIIKKVIRSSISDIISKGIDPKFILLSFSGPKKKINKKNIKLILNSIKQEEKKYNFSLIGGDTSVSIKISFTICVFGYSAKIIKRNFCSKNDDIYITGNIGDSEIGLNLLKKKINLPYNLKTYFIQKYYKPNLPYGFHRDLLKFANSSMDISDGLLVDLKKLIGDKPLGFILDYNRLPKSKYLKKISKRKNIKIKNFLFKGDDYQVLFTAKTKYRNIIKRCSNKWSQKVTRVGSILNKGGNFLKINKKVNKIKDYQGYIHNFN